MGYYYNDINNYNNYKTNYSGSSSNIGIHNYYDHRLIKATRNIQDFRATLKGSKHDELGSHRRMSTNFTLSNDGKFVAKTRIWTNDHWKGFHGSVVIYLIDAKDNWLWKIGPEEDWVDGQYVGHNDKTFIWETNIPAQDVKLIKGYAILHVTVSKPQFISTLNDVGKVAEKIKEIQNKF